MDETQRHLSVANDESALPLTADMVATYLTQNPDFLKRRPEMVDVLSPPDRSQDGAVVDFQRMMVDRLRSEVDSLRECAQSLIDTSRDNMSHQSRTHSATITLLSAEDFEHGARIVADDLPAILGLDAAAFGFEAVSPAPLGLDACGVRSFEEGAVDEMLGENREVRLLTDATDDGSVFGADAPRIRSCALIRLHARTADGSLLPPGILALGSHEPGTFQPGQGTELITFLARVLEKCTPQWTRQA